MLTRRTMVQGSAVALGALATGCATRRGGPREEPVVYPAGSLNRDIMETVAQLRATGDRLRAEKPELRHYRLPDAAFTEQLTYAGRAISAGNYYPATNCSTACFEAFVRTLNRVDARENGAVSAKLTYEDLTRSSGYPLRSWMMRSKSFSAPIGAASPKFQSMVGPADGFVLYGIGDIMSFQEAAPGDFVQFHRWTRGSGSTWNKYMQGHAVIFTGYLDVVTNEDGVKSLRENRRYDAAHNVGFTYFSSNSPTNGLSDRVGFFYGKTPEGIVEETPWDNNIQEPTSRDDLYALSFARLYQPSWWKRELTNVRIDSYRSGSSIYLLEAQNKLNPNRAYDPRYTAMAAEISSEMDMAAAERTDAALAAAFETEPTSFVSQYNMEE